MAATAGWSLSFIGLTFTQAFPSSYWTRKIIAFIANRWDRLSLFSGLYDTKYLLIITQRIAFWWVENIGIWAYSYSVLIKRSEPFLRDGHHRRRSSFVSRTLSPAHGMAMQIWQSLIFDLMMSSYLCHYLTFLTPDICYTNFSFVTWRCNCHFNYSHKTACISSVDRAYLFAVGIHTSQKQFR